MNNKNNLKAYELPRISIRPFGSESVVTGSGIIASLTDKGLTAENTVKIDFIDILKFGK